MLDMDYKLSLELMQEMGYEEGERRRLVDQDTGEICVLGQKEIVGPGAQGGKLAVEFDPINNSRMIGKLFGDFVNKLADEEEIEPCLTYGSFENKDGTIKVKATFADGSTIQSRKYKTEGLCYMDVIKQINGDDDVDLSKFDFERPKYNPYGAITPQKKGYDAKSRIANKKKGVNPK